MEEKHPLTAVKNIHMEVKPRKKRPTNTDLNKRIIELVDVDNFDAIVHALILEAKDGRQWAVQEVLNRVLGKPHQSTSVHQVNVDLTPDALRGRIDQIMGIKGVIVNEKTI